jgi:putative serine protease PepD
MGSQSRSVKFLSAHTVVERAPGSIAAVAARISPSVVSIQVQSDSAADEGSGFFISSDGYILTNNHVIDAAANGGSINVVLTTGGTYPAKIVGRDTAYDLAVLKINVTNAPAMQLGNSDLIQVGDPVIAVGSPLGLAGTVTTGIISAKNRAVTTDSEGVAQNSYINALQTDAAINPGNSGGPLVDMAGDVVGVNSAIASLGQNNPFSSSQAGSIGLGFAIPINQAKKTANQLIKTGHASYPIMGLELDSSYTQGAKVVNGPNAVKVGGPAAKAGIHAGDIILQIDNVIVGNSQEAIVAVRSHNVGDLIKVVISRNGKKLTFTLRLASSG